MYQNLFKIFLFSYKILVSSFLNYFSLLGLELGLRIFDSIIILRGINNFFLIFCIIFYYFLMLPFNFSSSLSKTKFFHRGSSYFVNKLPIIPALSHFHLYLMRKFFHNFFIKFLIFLWIFPKVRLNCIPIKRGRWYKGNYL